MSKQAIVIGVGASNGLGGALARRFSKGGLDLIAAGRTPEKLKIVVDEIQAAGGTARAAICDVTDQAAVDALFENAATDGPIDACLLYTSPSPRDATLSRMPSSA